jgi:hypothetical protein
MWAAIVSLALGYFVWRIPVQVTDCLANLFQVQEQTWAQSVTAGIGGGYMRPLLWAQIKAMFELAGGEYTAFFRSIHVLQVVACAALFVGALRVRDAAGALAVPFGIAMLLGAHTFDGTVREAFPINSFLTVVLGCLAAANLSLGAAARWKDAAAVALLAGVLLTVESGGLVWVCLAVAWLTGARGVSARGVAVATLVVVAYAVARFAYFDVGTPDLLERPSGFGFRTLEPQELKARFGGWPYGLYAYNVLCQVSTVLFSEPRTGLWVFTQRALQGTVRIGQVVAILTSVGATLLIVRYAIRHAAAWRGRAWTDGDRLVAIFAAVLVANATISFPYTKDVIMSPAGAFHALAASVAFADLLRSTAAARRLPATAIASVAAGLLASGAAVRMVGAAYTLRDAAFVARNEWTEVDRWARDNRIDITLPRRRELVSRLRRDAIARRAPAPTFASPRLARYFY